MDFWIYSNRKCFSENSQRKKKKENNTRRALRPASLFRQLKSTIHLTLPRMKMFRRIAPASGNSLRSIREQQRKLSRAEGTWLPSRGR
jgi:hypothetical protein